MNAPRTNITVTFHLKKKEKKNVIPKINYGFRGLSNAHDHTNIGSCSQIKEDLDDGSISEMYDTDSHFVWDKFDERPIIQMVYRHDHSSFRDKY